MLVYSAIPALSDRASKQSRATAYRLIRHMLVGTQSVEKLKDHPLDWYIVKYDCISPYVLRLWTQSFGRSLSRDNKHTVEKEQVIKLIRSVVEIGSLRRGLNSAVGTGTVPLSEAVMRAFMAVAEHPDEPFRPICIQTLTEIRKLSRLTRKRLYATHSHSPHRYPAHGADGRYTPIVACFKRRTTRIGTPHRLRVPVHR